MMREILDKITFIFKTKFLLVRKYNFLQYVEGWKTQKLEKIESVSHKCTENMYVNISNNTLLVNHHYYSLSYL